MCFKIKKSINDAVKSLGIWYQVLLYSLMILTLIVLCIPYYAYMQSASHAFGFGILVAAGICVPLILYEYKEILNSIVNVFIGIFATLSSYIVFIDKYNTIKYVYKIGDTYQSVTEFNSYEVVILLATQVLVCVKLGIELIELVQALNPKKKSDSPGAEIKK